MTQTRKWSLMAAVLAVAVLAAGWFLLVSPKRSDAAALREDAATAEQQNAQLVSKLNELKALSADLPKQQARLAQMRRQIPTTPALPSLVRALTTATRQSGIDLVSLAPSTPVALVDPAAATTVAPPAETSADSSDASASGETATDDSAATATAPAAPAETLMQVPLHLKMEGDYVEVEQFVRKLEGLKRVFLVTGFTLSEENADDPDEARVLTLELDGRVFMVHKQAATPAATSPANGSTSATTGAQ